MSIIKEFGFSNINSSKNNNLTGSVDHNKINKISLDNISNWYLFEGEVLMGFSFIRKYENILRSYVIPYHVDKKFLLKPEYVSFNCYGTTDLWYLILFLNNMSHPDQFIKEDIVIFNPSRMEVLNKLIELEYRNLYKMDNPKYISKHVLKDLNEPSEKILGDNDDEIDSIPLKDYEPCKDFSETNGYGYDISDNEKYFFIGKTRLITKSLDNKFNKQISYMNGIKFNHEGINRFMEGKYTNTEFDYTGYLYFPKPGNYKFKIECEGQAYIKINDRILLSDLLSLTDDERSEKQFDFFELLTLNSDFKKRTLDGWGIMGDSNSIDPNGVIESDNRIKKPVFHRNYDNEDIINEKLLCGEVINKDNIFSKEPLTNEIGDVILFRNSYKTLNIENLIIKPFLKCIYKDGYIDEVDVDNSFLDNGKYNSFDLSLLKRNDNIDRIQFGFTVNKIDKQKNSSGDIYIDSVSLNLINLSGFEFNVEKEGWYPFNFNYKRVNEGISLFNVYRKKDNEGYKLIDNTDIAIKLRKDTDNFLDCSNVTKIYQLDSENELNLKKEFMLTSINENINKFYSVNNSIIEKDFFLKVYNNNDIYSFVYDDNDIIEVYIDGKLTFSNSGNNKPLYIKDDNQEIPPNISDINIDIKGDKFNDEYYLKRIKVFIKKLSEGNDLKFNILRNSKPISYNDICTIPVLAKPIYDLINKNNLNQKSILKTSYLEYKQQPIGEHKSTDDWVMEFSLDNYSTTTGLFIFEFDIQKNKDSYMFILPYINENSYFGKTDIKTGIYKHIYDEKEEVQAFINNKELVDYKINIKDLDIIQSVNIDDPNHPSNFVLQTNITYKFKIVRKKNRMTLYINNQRLIVYIDNSNNVFKDGTFNFISFLLDRIKISNMVLYK